MKIDKMLFGNTTNEMNGSHSDSKEKDKIMNNMPKVTIVMISYNIVTEVESTIKSIINQTYPNIEYLVIDGGSTDGTVDIIKKYQDNITSWTSEPDKGLYDAMNKGIERATGEWIIFMNGGDSFFSNHAIADVIAKIDYDTIIAYGRLMCYYPTFKFVYKNEPLNLSLLVKRSIMPHQATFINVAYHKRHLYDNKLKSASDYKFFYYAYFRDKVKFQFVSVIVANFDNYGGVSKSIKVIKEDEVSYLNGTRKSHIYRLKTYIVVLKLSIRNILPIQIAMLYRRTHLALMGFKTFSLKDKSMNE